MPEMSQREYAEHQGVSLRAIQKRVLSGGITLNANGKIDSEVADKQWLERRDPDHIPAEEQDELADLDQLGEETESYTGVKLDIARMRREKEALDLAAQRKLLVEKRKVEHAAFEAGRRVRDMVQNIPARLAPLLAAEFDLDQHKARTWLEVELAKMLSDKATEIAASDEDKEDAA